MPNVISIPLNHPGPPDVRVWRIDFVFDWPLSSPAFDSLSEAEHERARRFHHHEDAVRFASVRAGLRALLADELGRGARDIAFATGDAGRPYVRDSRSPVDFNVSHSGAHGLIALSTRRRVGADIEVLADGFDWRTVAASTLSADESAFLDTLDPASASRAFFDAWVAKEALLKAAGTGIGDHLSQLTVIPACAPPSVPFRAQANLANDLRASWIDAPQGYAACIAWSP